MTEHSPIDEQFRQHRKDWDGPPPTRVWDSLEDRLDAYAAPQGQRQKKLFRLGIAATVLFVVGLSFAFFLTRQNTTGHLAVLADTETDFMETIHPTVAQKGEAEATPPVPMGYRTKPTAAPRTGDVRTAAAVAEAEQSRTEEESPVLPSGQPATPTLEREDEDVVATAPQEALSRERFALEDEIVRKMESPASTDAQQKSHISEVQAAQAKREGQERDRQAKKASAPSTATGGNYSGMDAVASYKAGGDRTEAFATRTLTILFPGDRQDNCAFSAILVESDRYFVDACQGDALDIAKNTANQLGRDDLLYTLLHDREEYVRQVSARSISGCPDAGRITFVYRLTTSLSSLEDRVTWPMNSDCLTQEEAQVLQELLRITESAE